MSIRLHVEQDERRVLARFSGSGQVGEITLRYPQIVAECERAGAKKLLLDFSQVRMLLSLQDRYDLGNQAAIFARNGIKVAVMAPPALLDPDRFAAMLARNRGVRLGVFTEWQAAVEWLAEE